MALENGNALLMRLVTALFIAFILGGVGVYASVTSLDSRVTEQAARMDRRDCIDREFRHEISSQLMEIRNLLQKQINEERKR